MNRTNAQGSDHPHPNYVALWMLLVGLLIVGILVGFVGHPVIGAVLVFGVASLKAFIVAMNYMHLKHEPLIVRAILLCGIACVLIVLFGLIPDIVYGLGR